MRLFKDPLLLPACLPLTPAVGKSVAFNMVVRGRERPAEARGVKSMAGEPNHSQRAENPSGFSDSADS